MIRFISLLAISTFLIFTAGCVRSDEANADAVNLQPAMTTEEASVMSTLPTPEPSPTVTVKPTVIPAHVAIENQALDGSGKLSAAEVSLPASGWLAIYNSLNGEPDQLIGRASLAAGVHHDIQITVDAAEATEELFARLHIDLGTAGVFEYPGEDKPFPGESEREFAVELRMPRPKIGVDSQEVTEDGVVILTEVELLAPSWVLIHADQNGEIGAVLGGVLLDAGSYENVPMTIDWRRATPTLHALLHVDEGETGVIDYPDGDMPILVNGLPIVATFKATYPPDIVVYDQPLIDGTVTIERVISNGPGWVVIQNEIDEQPGLIIGSAPLHDGLNEGITVTLKLTAITSQLFARIHEDTEEGNALNFPAQDPAVRYNGRLPNAAGFRLGDYALAFVRDQKALEGAITIDVLVAPAEGWAAVFADDGGQPDSLLGKTWVPAGVNRDVSVTLAPFPTDSTVLHLVLFQDLGKPKVFEPDVDIFMTGDDNRPVQIPFDIIVAAGN